MILKQQKGGYKRTFELQDTILKTTYYSILSSEEWSIDLENIGHKKEIKSYPRLGLNILGGFFSIIALLSLLVCFVEEESREDMGSFIIGITFMVLLAVVCFKVPMDDNLTLVDGERNVKFILDSPSREVVEQFADELVIRSRKLIKEKYSRVDPDLSEETFMYRIDALLQNKYLSEEEYQKLKVEYKTKKLL